jgi:hypothetical protein
MKSRSQFLGLLSLGWTTFRPRLRRTKTLTMAGVDAGGEVLLRRSSPLMAPMPMVVLHGSLYTVA